MIRLGTFSRPGEDRRFAGLVTDADTVVDLGTTVEDLLADWDRALGELDARRDEAGTPLADLHVHAPLAARADPAVGRELPHPRHRPGRRPPRRARGPAGHELLEIRAEVAALMDRRAAEGTPYLFIGLPSAVTGPHDDVVIPPWTQKFDWELELAAVIGREAFRVDRDRALSHVAGYTIANDLTARDQVFRRDMPEIGTDWFRGKNGPGFTPSVRGSSRPGTSTPATCASTSSSTAR